ncbi:MAG: hypothetical protein ACOCW6_09480 [Spirochaetota bacterium]
MRRRINRTYFVIPVVYAGVIFFLLFLQFSGGEVFVERLGPLVLRANIVTNPRSQESSLSHVRVEYEGLSFEFDSDRSVVLREPSGREVRQELVSYETLDNGFSLRFAEGAEIRFLLAGDENGELHIKPSIQDDGRSYEAIRLPFELSGGARLEAEGEEAVVPITYGSGRYLLAPPARASIDPETRQILLPGNVLSQTVRYSAAAQNQQEPILALFEDGALSVSDGAFEAAVRGYVDVSYRGWQRRFNGGSGTWLSRDGTSEFDEKILAAYLAEAWRRNEYVSAFNRMRRAADLHSGEVGLLSAPYLGNLRDVRQDFLQADAEKSQELLELVEAGDFDVFLTENLGEFALYRATTEFRDAFFDFLRRLDPQNADVYQAIGMLKAALFTELPTEESREAFEALYSVANNPLMSSLVQVDDGFLLETVSGQVDVLASLEGGIVLNALGDETGDQRYRDIGRNLVLSALALADETGFLPRVLLASGRTAQGQDGSFGLEAVYPLLIDNTAYPHLVSLFDEFGPGSWIWTVAEVSQVERRGDDLRIGIRYPRNRTHFLILQGVPPFSGMELFGQPWRTDPAFESYVKGRHYNAETNTLMIKYTDNSVTGNIILEY